MPVVPPAPAFRMIASRCGMPSSNLAASKWTELRDVRSKFSGWRVTRFEEMGSRRFHFRSR